MRHTYSSLLLLALLGAAGHVSAQTSRPAAPASRAAAPAARPQSTERLALSEAADPAAAPAAATKYTLQGQVLNEEGRPLPGATIFVKSNKEVYTTNSEGFFTFSSPRPTEVAEVTRAGYGAAELQLRRGSTESVTLQLLPGTKIKRSGRNAGKITTVGKATE